ncbi:hypothetical protein [Paralcaligenes ginsengisoli]
MNEITVLAAMQKLDLQPGDTVVLSVSNLINEEQRRVINDFAARTFPDNQVVILGSEIQIGTMGSDDRLTRLEAKLDVLLAAFGAPAEDDEQIDVTTFDGEYAGCPRDRSSTL